MLTTVIGAYPKPSYLRITDWFNASGGTDTEYPTKFYEEEIRPKSDFDDEAVLQYKLSMDSTGVFGNKKY